MGEYYHNSGVNEKQCDIIVKHANRLNVADTKMLAWDRQLFVNWFLEKKKSWIVIHVEINWFDLPNMKWCQLLSTDKTIKTKKPEIKFLVKRHCCDRKCKLRSLNAIWFSRMNILCGKIKDKVVVSIVEMVKIWLILFRNNVYMCWLLLMLNIFIVKALWVISVLSSSMSVMKTKALFGFGS